MTVERARAGKTGQLREMHQGRVGLSPRRPRKLRCAARSAPTQDTDQGRNAQPRPDAPRIVTLDIETAPLSSYHWGLWQENIGIEQIGTEWSILSVAWKWLGETKVHQVDTAGRNVRNDRKLLGALWSVLDQADIVVGQNAKKFDVRKINARLLLSGFRPYAPVKIVDTMLAAKRHFAFTSNKLAWLSKHLTPAKKSEHKQFPGFSLWSECLKGNRAAWAEMRKYNVRDVVATEQLYLRLRPWIEGHPNVATYTDSEEPACPKCGSPKLARWGNAFTQTGQYQRYRCGACFTFARSRYTLNTTGKRRSLLAA